MEARGTAHPCGTNPRRNATIQYRLEDPTNAAADPPAGSGQEQTAVPPWMALSLPHRPDATLLRKSQCERALPENTTRALLVAEHAGLTTNTSQHNRVDELKHCHNLPRSGVISIIG